MGYVRWITYGAPGEIRTPDLQLRRLPLYPAELRAHTGATSLHAAKNHHQRPELSAAATAITSAITAITSATTSATMSATEASAATATGAVRFGTRFIYIESATTDLRAVDSGNGLLAFLSIRHLNESKTARAASLAIGQDADPVHLTVRRKQLP